MVPNGWSLKLISDTAKVITGNTPSTKVSSYYNGDIPFVSPADLGANKLISSANKTLTKKGFDKSRAVRKGSTLFTCIGSTIGKLGQANCELATNQQINAVIPYSSFDDDFIYYQLEMRAKFISKLAGTQAVPIINKTTFESQNLLVPDSLPEQRKIAKILSTWDKAIATTEQLIATSQQQKKALMQQLLTGKKRLLNPETGKVFEGDWLIKHLKNIGKLQAGKFVKASEIFNTEDESLFPCYGGNGLRGFTASYTHEGLYSLIGRQGALCGNITLAEGKFHATEHAVVVTPYKHIDTKWLYYKLIELDLNQYATGQAQPGLSVKNLDPLEVLVAPLKEQQKIASVLTVADKEIELLQAKLAHLKEEKKALMQQLLTGKRRVKIELMEGATC
ncbi:MAG: restriction endonuclease subunit S [Vibrio sp.]